MKKVARDNFIRLFPNIHFLKQIASREWVRRVKSHYIPEEEVIAGECNSQIKKQLVDKYLSANHDFLRPIKSLAREILSQNGVYKFRNDQDTIFIDMLFCYLAYGFQPNEYLYFELESKSLEERRKWISDSDRFIYIYSMNDFKDSLLFNNKVKTYEFFKEYYGREAVGIKSRRDYPKFLSFVRKHPIFVKKQAFEGAGHSVELVDSSKMDISLHDYFKHLITKGIHIIEERIIQDGRLRELNSSSVNTVRCITFNTRNGIIIPFCFMKIGQNGSFVDNGGSGGILVGIDEQSGEFVTDGYDENNVRYLKHPDTKIVFKGFRLPDWNNALSLCRTVSAMSPSVKCIGWDLAYTSQGWIIVEGNGKTQMIGPQIVSKIGTKEKTLTILKNIDLIVPLSDNHTEEIFTKTKYDKKLEAQNEKHK